MISLCPLCSRRCKQDNSFTITVRCPRFKQKGKPYEDEARVLREEAKTEILRQFNHDGKGKRNDEKSVSEVSCKDQKNNAL